MASEKPAPWTGASGTEYAFYVFGLEPDVPRRLGNYIYAKRNEHGAWVPIYMGHGDLSVCCIDPALRRCIASKDATHVHLRLNGAEVDRDAELQDLLAHYANAFAPEGCQPATEPASSLVSTPASGQPLAAEAGTPPRSRATRKTQPKAPPAKKASRTGTKTSAAKSKAVTKTPAGRKTAVKTKPKSPRPRAK